MIAGGYVFDTYFQDYFVIGDYENKKTMVYERLVLQTENSDDFCHAKNDIFFHWFLRFASSSIVLNNCTLWVVGGHDGYLELR